MRSNICLCWAIAAFMLLVGCIGEGLAGNKLMVENRYGEPGQPGPHQPGLVIPVVGTWDDSLVAYTISLKFDTTFIRVLDVNIDGTKADGAPVFIPQWSNDYDSGYVTAEVVMGTQFPEDEGNAIAPDTAGSPLLNMVVEIKKTAPYATSTALSFRDGLGTPPVENRFYGTGGDAVPPDTVAGWLQTTYVLFCDFQDDACNFDTVTVGGTLMEWEWGSDVLENPANKVWGTDLDSDYDPEACYGLVSPDVVLPMDGWGSAYLTFHHRHRFNLVKKDDPGDDGGHIERFTSDPDTPWVMIYPDWRPYDGSVQNACFEISDGVYRKGYTGHSFGYPAFLRAGFDLSGLGYNDTLCAGSCYKVRWRFGSNKYGAVDTGWYIDSVRIAVAPTESGMFFIRGDVNNDGRVDTTDLTFLQDYLDGQVDSIPPPCDRADVDDDGVCCSWDDVDFLTDVLAVDTIVPPWPYPDPGIDSSPDSIPPGACSRFTKKELFRHDAQTERGRLPSRSSQTSQGLNRR